MADTEANGYGSQPTGSCRGHPLRATLILGKALWTRVLERFAARAATGMTLGALGEDDGAGWENAPARPMPLD
ncbi:MAG: hypothetical protein M3R02_27535 [Chloroflexota bacterium]|nr:hypothetical protein [Chloroflexota bacterium]